MFGCSNPILIYGWIENNSDKMLDPEWIETNYPNIGFYASEVVRNHMYSASYGIECKLTNQGIISVNKEKKQIVQQFYDLWCKYQEKKNNKLPELGYYLVICGDFEWEHTYYTI
jgi:hypothetical protein